MKTSRNIAASLGFTQEEMAVMLGISRSAWSLYELGLRELPTKALVLLSKIERHVDFADTAKKSAELAEKRQPEKRARLEHLLRENEFEQRKLARKIEAHEQKQQIALKRMHAVEALAEHHAEQGKAAGRHFVPSETKGYKYEYKLAALEVDQELKKEMLAYERKLIEGKLKKMK